MAGVVTVFGQTTNNAFPNLQRSGWTTTTNPAAARAALGVSSGGSAGLTNAPNVPVGVITNGAIGTNLPAVNLGTGFGLFRKVAALAGNAPLKVVVIGNSMTEPSSSIAAVSIRAWENKFGFAGTGLGDYWQYSKQWYDPTTGSYSLDTNWPGYYFQLTPGSWAGWTNSYASNGFYADRLGLFYISRAATNSFRLMCSTNGGAYGTLAVIQSPSTSGLQYTNFSMPLASYRLFVTNTGSATQAVIQAEYINTGSNGIAPYFIQRGGVTMSNLNDSIRNVTNAIAKINPNVIWFALKETMPVQYSNYLSVFKTLASSFDGPMLIQGEYYEGDDTNRNPQNPDVSSPFLAYQSLTNGWGFFHSAYYGQSYSNQVAQGWMDGVDTIHMTGNGGVALGNRLQTEFGLKPSAMGGGPTNRSDIPVGVLSGGAIGTDTSALVQSTNGHAYNFTSHSYGGSGVISFAAPDGAFDIDIVTDGEVNFISQGTPAISAYTFDANVTSTGFRQFGVGYFEGNGFAITNIAPQNLSTPTNNVKGATNWVLVISGTNSFWTNQVPAEMVADRAPTNAPVIQYATLISPTITGNNTNNGIAVQATNSWVPTNVITVMVVSNSPTTTDRTFIRVNTTEAVGWSGTAGFTRIPNLQVGTSLRINGATTFLTQPAANRLKVSGNSDGSGICAVEAHSLFGSNGVASATVVTATNGFIFPYLQPTTNGLNSQGGIIGSNGTNFWTVQRDSAGVLATNKFTLTTWP